MDLRRQRRRLVMRWRRFRHRLSNVHVTSYIARDVKLKSDLRMAEYSFINQGCQLNPGVSIGRYSLLGPNVSIVGGDHIFDQVGVPIAFSGRPPMPETVIEDDVWIGQGAILMSGIRVGRGSIIAAGAVVTDDVPAYEIHGGVPARKLRDRFDQAQRKIHDQALDGPLLAESPCPPKSVPG